jgi:hypothetical protein
VATVGNAAFRCAGLLGRHRPGVVDSISDDEQQAVGKRCLYVCFAVSVAILLGLLPLVAGRLGSAQPPDDQPPAQMAPDQPG